MPWSSRVKGRAFGSPLARGLFPRASTAEVDPQAKPALIRFANEDCKARGPGRRDGSAATLVRCHFGTEAALYFFGGAWALILSRFFCMAGLVAGLANATAFSADLSASAWFPILA